MRDAAEHLPDILERIRARGCVLLLDFDGTLSPIVPRHGDAALAPGVRPLLKRCAARMPVAVISGRSLADVRRRVGLSGISYAGCHGLECDTRAGMPARVRVSEKAARAFRDAKCLLRALARDYRGISIEDKRMSFAMHYRALSSSAARACRGKARAAIAPHVRKGLLRAIDHLYTFDIMPDVGQTKEHAAREMYRRLRKRRDAVPVYIGDGTTDEDAFRAFKTGVTIRVGRKSGSAARYFFRSRSQVGAFIAALAA